MKPDVAQVLRLLVDESVRVDRPHPRLDVEGRASSIVEGLQAGWMVLEKLPEGAALVVTDAGVRALAEHLMGRPS